jgi:Protein of unknown function (DUF559)
LARARSDAEARALEVLAVAGVAPPLLNVRYEGEEADLSWPADRLIVEIDGAQFHQDPAEDARKDRVWRGAGWTVVRLPSPVVFERPETLIEIANVPAPTAVGRWLHVRG